jgi:hypothetical protein
MSFERKVKLSHENRKSERWKEGRFFAFGFANRFGKKCLGKK